MPIYEFGCGSCGERFEALVDAGTQSVACRACGAEPTKRLFSAPAAPPAIVQTPGQKRRREGANAKLRDRTKADFKARRKRAREARGGGGG